MRPMKLVAVQQRTCPRMMLAQSCLPAAGGGTLHRRYVVPRESVGAGHYNLYTPYVVLAQVPVCYLPG